MGKKDKQNGAQGKNAKNARNAANMQNRATNSDPAPQQTNVERQNTQTQSKK